MKKKKQNYPKKKKRTYNKVKKLAKEKKIQYFKKNLTLPIKLPIY